MYEVNRNASVEYTPRARTSEFPTAIAKGGTEFRSQVFLGASVHGYIFVGSSIRSQTAWPKFEMATNRSATVGNKFVTVRRRLSADEQRDIKSLHVKVGKIGGYVRSRGRSGVWTYFGELCFKDESWMNSFLEMPFLFSIDASLKLHGKPLTNR